MLLLCSVENLDLTRDSRSSSYFLTIVTQKLLITDDSLSVSDNRIRFFNTIRYIRYKYPCPTPNCRSTFVWKRNLISHLRYQCGQLPRFKCPYCDCKCKYKTDVRKHVRAKHKNRHVFVIDEGQSEKST